MATLPDSYSSRVISAILSQWSWQSGLWSRLPPPWGALLTRCLPCNLSLQHVRDSPSTWICLANPMPNVIPRVVGAVACKARRSSPLSQKLARSQGLEQQILRWPCSGEKVTICEKPCVGLTRRTALYRAPVVPKPVSEC